MLVGRKIPHTRQSHQFSPVSRNIQGLPNTHMDHYRTSKLSHGAAGATSGSENKLGRLRTTEALFVIAVVVSI